MKQKNDYKPKNTDQTLGTDPNWANEWRDYYSQPDSPDPDAPDDDLWEMRDAVRRLESLPRSPHAPDKRKRGESWQSVKPMRGALDELREEVDELRAVLRDLDRLPPSKHRPLQPPQVAARPDASSSPKQRPAQPPKVAQRPRVMSSGVPSNAELYDLVRRLERRLNSLENRVARNPYDPERRNEDWWWGVLFAAGAFILILLIL